jgi:tetratricopeptide (TPR) repeat protein
MQSGDPWWARTLLEEAGTLSRELLALKIDLDLAIDDPAPAITQWLQEYDDEEALDAAMSWWIRSGRVEEAERLLNRAPGLDLWRARLAVWRRQPEVALGLLKNLAPSPQVTCLQGICAVLLGQLADAEALLRPLVDSEVGVEAWSWLATILRKQNRYEEAIRAADAARMASRGFHLVPLLERELSVAARERRIRDLELDWVLDSIGVDPDLPLSAIEQIIERFGGNHTPDLTLADGGKLTSVPRCIDPGQLGVSVQLVLRTRGPEAVRDLYHQLAPRVDGHPRFLIYQGETELWLGNYNAAAQVFRVALARSNNVKWAWIGLGASALLQGDFRRAQEIWAEGLSITRWAGPTLYVYRGECYRRQGEVELARRDLYEAVIQKPQRLSAWINLALLDPREEIVDWVEGALLELAPILMDELTGSRAERLEKVLEAMRGNRSSSRITYHLWGRLWHSHTGSLRNWPTLPSLPDVAGSRRC